VFDLLILPDSKCLRASEIKELEKFVSDGGSLLVIGKTAIATALNQYRPIWGLSKIFRRTDAPVSAKTAYDKVSQSTSEVAGRSVLEDRCIETSFGSGKAIYLAGLDFSLPDKQTLNTFAGYDWYYHPYWKAPKDSDTFLQSVEKLLGADWRIRTDLPRTVGLECYQIEKGYRLCLVNYRHPEPVGRTSIQIKAPTIKSPALNIIWHTPEGQQSLEAQFGSDGEISISLPGFVLLATISIYVS